MPAGTHWAARSCWNGQAPSACVRPACQGHGPLPPSAANPALPAAAHPALAPTLLCIVQLPPTGPHDASHDCAVQRVRHFHVQGGCWQLELVCAPSQCWEHVPVSARSMCQSVLGARPRRSRRSQLGGTRWECPVPRLQHLAHRERSLQCGNPSCKHAARSRLQPPVHWASPRQPPVHCATRRAPSSTPAWRMCGGRTTWASRSSGEGFTVKHVLHVLVRVHQWIGWWRL